MWKQRNERGIIGDPPCEDCREDLLPENKDAGVIFNMIRNQLIIIMSGVVDINHLAVHEAMRLKKIKDKESCFEKVTHLGIWWVNKLNKKD